MAEAAPSLVSLLGTGTMLVGERDRDVATGTCVKTHALTVLFVPVVALGAWRVFDAPDGGWFFRERVPLSPFARGWNKLFALLLVVAVGVAGWFFYMRGENYKAGQLLARADRLAREGQGAEAATLYRDLMLGGTSMAGAARERFDTLAIEPPGDLNDAATIYQLAVALQQQQLHVVHGLFDHAVTFARQHEESDPAGAVAVLEAVAPLAPKPAEHLQAYRRLLERMVTKSPDDLDLTTRLAGVCADLGDLKRCETLLAKHEARLGDRDAAALLGHLYARQGKFDQAEKLLTTYLDSRLPKLRAADEAFRVARESAEKRIAESLREAKATDFDYTLFHGSPPADQDRLLFQYRNRKLNDDPDLREAFVERAKQQRVPAAAQDLAAIYQQRAGMLMQALARDLVGNAIDLNVLQRPAGLDLLASLYRDQAGREPYRARIRAHPGLAKAQGYFEKLLALAPGLPSAYSSLTVIFDERGDLDGLRRLAKQVGEVRLDLDVSRRQTLDRYAGKGVDQEREALRQSTKRLEACLPAARKAGGVTHAVAATRVVTGRLAGAQHDLPVDLDGLLALAHEADTAAPSATTRATLIEVHQLRAHRRLAEKDKQYAEEAKRTKRSLGTQLVGWVVGQPGPLRDVALANADVKEALRLTREQAKAFPDEANVGTWALLRAAYPEDAAALAKRLKESPRQPLLRTLDRALAPLSAPGIVNAYWWLVLDGKQAEADELLSAQAKLGVPLPTAPHAKEREGHRAN